MDTDAFPYFLSSLFSPILSCFLLSSSPSPSLPSPPLSSLPLPPSQSVEGVIETESGEEISIKLLDTDSVTQAKEKVLDALYRNTPVSKRPQLTSVDLGECVRVCV